MPVRYSTPAAIPMRFRAMVPQSGMYWKPGRVRTSRRLAVSGFSLNAMRATKRMSNGDAKVTKSHQDSTVQDIQVNGRISSAAVTVTCLPYGRHLQWVLKHHRRLRQLINKDGKELTITICGNSLTIADVVAASRCVRLRSKP